MAFSKAKTAVGNLFKKYLLLTNTVSCGGLLAIGDAITQKMEHSGHDPATFKYDWPRTGRMFTVGLMMGPFNHAWYTFLDKMLVGNSGKIVFKKICCDQMVAAPYFCTTFLMGMSLLEGKGWSVSFSEWKEKFLVIYAMDWFIWPPSQFINFYFLPTEYRVLYVCFITLIWDTLLSYIKHKEQAAEKYKLLEAESTNKIVELVESSSENSSEDKVEQKLLEENTVKIVELVESSSENLSEDTTQQKLLEAESTNKIVELVESPSETPSEDKPLVVETEAPAPVPAPA